MDKKSEKKSYEIQNLIRYFKRFNKEVIKIEGETKEFNLVLLNGNFAHLMGLHYMYKEPNEVYGGKVIGDIEKLKLSDQDIYSRIETNNIKILDKVKDRIESIKYILENLEKTTIVEKTSNTDNSDLKSNYLMIKMKDNKYLQLGVVHLEGHSDYFETYLINNDNYHFKDTVIEEGVKGIWRETEEGYEPFSFNKVKNDMLKALYILNGDISYQKAIEVIDRNLAIKKLTKDHEEKVKEEKIEKEETESKGWGNRKKSNEELER